MTDAIIKDHRINNLQREYVRYSSLLHNLQNHVERCTTDNIISTADRNNYLKIINDLLRQMNTTYNAHMMNIDDTDSSSEKAQYVHHSTFDDIKNLYELHKILSVGRVDNTLAGIFDDPFAEINKSLLSKISLHLGFYTLYDGLGTLISEHFLKYCSKEVASMLEVYNCTFVPLKYSIKTFADCDKQVLIRAGVLGHDTVIESAVDICVQRLDDTKTYVVFTGYFNNDSLNIVLKTSQVCYNFLYQKKKAIELYVGKKPINDKFAKAYLKNASLGDVIILSDEEFYAKLEKDYMTYNRLIKLPFMNLMKEFIKTDRDRDRDSDDNGRGDRDKNIEKAVDKIVDDISGGGIGMGSKQVIDEKLDEKIVSVIGESSSKEEKINLKHMFRIIKLLLLGTDESINVAGLLFGISKEKRPGSDFSLADIIYKNLSYMLQIKLRKSSVNIKNELEKLKTLSAEDVDLKKQVAICKNMPDIVKRATIEKIEEMKSSNNEYYKQLLYVKTLLNYPWPGVEAENFFTDIGKSSKTTRTFIDGVVVKLNEKVYGHDVCKNCIKELIGQWITNPASSGTALGLAGPPGVGKTLIAKAIGDALNIPFVQITLGGQNDGDLLHGHGYTYSGAQPGMVVKKMVEAGNARCIMYFDELDKACKKHDSNEIFSILIHLIDPNTNKEFQDRFFQEINFPLDKVLFIFSYNDSALVDSILMDRINEIKVKPFKLGDKKIIANKFMLKEMCKLVSFEPGSIVIKEEELEFIIENYTYEAGVRDLRRKLEQIFLKLNIDRIYKKELFKEGDTNTKNSEDVKNQEKDIGSGTPIIVTRDLIQSYLGKESIQIQSVHSDDLVGVINGLYATDSGKGGILPIQVYTNYTGSEDKFTLKLTGSQRRVMKESVVSAFTTAINIVRDDIRNEYIGRNPFGFHVHTPSGAVPKDGPSAGCAFTTAFLSRILNKKIRHDVGMTGEIELTGKITKIGGLAYKLTGAKRAGIHLVFVPSENKSDIDTIKVDYKDLFDDSFKILFADHISQILEHVLIDFDKTALSN